MGHYSDVAQALESALSGITDIGTIHKGWPLIINQTDVVDQFLYELPAGNKILRTWIITRTRRLNEYETTTETTAIDEWTIYHYYGYNDDQTPPSDEEFQEFLDDVFDEIMPDLTIDDYFYTRTPLQAQNMGLKLFCGVLCHYAEIVFQGSWEKTF